jgi:dienelactone hydrolase
MLFAAMLVFALACSDREILAQVPTDLSVSKNQVDLPDQISIDVPGKEIASGLAAFSGAWAGDGWNGIIPIALVVEKINGDGSASAIFAWGDVVKPPRKRGWLRVAANIERGRLAFSIPDQGEVEFSVTPDERLLGRYTLPNGRRDYAILNRIVDGGRAQIIAASEGMLSGEVITFPLVSDPGQAVQLKGILYRSKNEGRRPLAIFSADSAFNEGIRTEPARAPIKSRQMLGLGYSLLALQRKGMGGSGGSFLEPADASIPQGRQLQSALEDLDAAISFMKQQEYVDPSRIVLVGFRRGGLLSVVYAGLHDGSVAGVVNTSGNWRVRRNWWEKLFTWEDFTAKQFSDAGKTKLPMLWTYSAYDPSFLEYARSNFRGFTHRGGRGTFVEIPADKSGAEREESAISEYIENIR